MQKRNIVLYKREEVMLMCTKAGDRIDLNIK